MSAMDSVLLVAFGGPERSEDIRPFLQIVTTGRAISAARLEEVAHHYEIIGGRSPLNALTRRQGDALASALAARERALPVWVGMRNWHPFLHETLAEMKDRGRRRAVGIILSSLQTEASWARYMDDVAAAREKVGPDAPEVVFAPPWADHPRFVDAMAARTRAALEAVEPARRAAARLVFTAHSVPVAMATGSPYAAQLEAAGRAIAGRLGRARFTIAYQSRSGSPRDPWLEPDVADAIRALGREGARDVVVVPVGFVCDHVEVLYDLDVEARRAAEAAGVVFHRAPAANDHPDFIAMLADLVDRVTER
ncbi:MAG TPA: ferrochelatase [Methylomirabilota bacterium]|nr:ferrochelatase [Methylomirabilota bacterium]